MLCVLRASNSSPKQRGSSQLQQWEFRLSCWLYWERDSAACKVSALGSDLCFLNAPLDRSGSVWGPAKVCRVLLGDGSDEENIPTHSGGRRGQNYVIVRRRAKGASSAPAAERQKTAARSPKKLPGVLRKASPAPYVRRVGWLREIQATIREHKREHAVHILRLLRKDLGLEGTFLNEVLYKNATFLNLVDPISHDLLMSLARDLQCPKKEYDPWKSSDRICRQLIYHLTPHSKWHRHGMPRRKSQMCLKNSLQKKVSQGSMDLSGIPLTMRDVHRMAYYLQNNGDHLTSVDLSFTELNDDMVRLLLPFLWVLPKLTHLSLNGNRLTRATMKELTDTMKDMNKFPCLAWVDLGNNVDVSSMPQPLLVGLRKRLSQQTTLPTIYEALDCDPEISSGQEGGRPEGEEAGSTPRLAVPQQGCER
ncbi:leucine-rich repeat-containing protein 75B [Lagopus muta]|uniref:leucine-rich repeat-containing protein 75B n=1 Tax=Lagopus muta TaxID=64668 RepID=UPI00209CE85A|nr:leucine-rich repeat-containing protein 75B [Lagopus muta]